MRAQSSVEFLTTYSFLFIILSVVVVVILFLATAPTTSIPAQCSGYGGPTCNFVQVYSNKSAGYSLVTISLTNSQSVPINITNISTQIRSVGSLGTCTPAFLYPGQESTCVTKLSGALPVGSLTQGFYVVNALYCNSGVSNVSRGSCQYEHVPYGGAFQTSPVQQRAVVFSVVVSQTPQNLQRIPFSAAFGTTPRQPNNFTILQNFQWIDNVTTGALAYAYATNTPMLGTTYLGYKALAFPQGTSALSNNNIACGSPYNSILSIASTTLYAPATASPVVSIETTGPMQVFYKVGTLGTAWQDVFSSSVWGTNTLTSPTPASISLSSGTLYNVEVAWENTCGGGVQVFKVTGLPG